MGMQVITIGAGGEVSGLQRKPGQGVDLRQFGRAKIERASEIVWDDDRQRWLVSIFSGQVFNSVGLQLTGTALTLRMWAAGAMLLKAHLRDLGGELDESLDEPILFLDYEQAVAAEIAYLDALRLRGYLR